MYLEIWQRSSWGSEYVRYAVDQHCNWCANMCYMLHVAKNGFINQVRSARPRMQPTQMNFPDWVDWNVCMYCTSADVE